MIFCFIIKRIVAYLVITEFQGHHTNQACLSGHFKPRQRCLAGKNQMSRVTLLRLPAIVRPGFQLTLCWLSSALFSFHQTQLLRAVSAWLPGTVFILDMYNVVVNSSYVLGGWYQVLGNNNPMAPYQSGLLQIRYYAARIIALHPPVGLWYIER